MAQHKLTMVLAAETTQFSKKMSDVSKRIKSLNSDVQRFGKSFLSNMNLIKVKGASALVAAVKVQDAFKIIQAGTGATAEKLKGLQDEFKKLASSVPDSYQASATAIADLNTMLGLSGQSLQEMSKAMLDLTRLAGGDLKGNIAAVSQAMNSWGENSTSAVNDLYVVSQNTGVSIAKLTAEMTKNSDVLTLLGYDYSSAAVLLGQMNHQGLNTEKALSGLRNAASQLVSSGIKDLSGGFQSIVDAVKSAANETDAARIAMKYFGKESGTTWAAAIRSGAVNTEELTNKLAKLSTQLADDAQASQTFTERVSRAFNNIGIALQPVGEALLSLTENYVVPLIEKFFTSSPAMTEFFTIATAGVASISALSWGINGLMSGFSWFAERLPKITNFINNIVTSFTAWTSAATAAKGAMIGLNGALSISSGGILAVLAAVGALAAAVYSMGRYFTDFNSSVDSSVAHIENLKDRIDDVKEAVLNLSETSWSLRIGEAQAQIQNLTAELEKLQKSQQEALASYALRGRSADRISTPYDDKIKQTTEALDSAKQNKLILEQAAQYKSIYAQMQDMLQQFRVDVAADGADVATLKDKTYKEMSGLITQLKGTSFEGDPRLRSVLSQVTNYRKNELPIISTTSKSIDDTAERMRWQNSNGFLSDNDYQKYLSTRLAALTRGKAAWNKDARSTYDELQRMTKQTQSKQDEALRWQNSAGFLNNADYAGILQQRLAEQTKGLNWKDWGEDARSTFGELQRVINEEAAPALDMLKERYTSGQISIGEYQTQLQAMMDKYAEFPAVTEKIGQAMDNAKGKTMSFAEGMKAAIDNAVQDVDKLALTTTEGLADSFARAAVYGDSLGDSLKKLGQDIMYTVAKMLILKTLTNAFSGLFGGGSAAASAPPVADGVFAKGGAFAGGIKAFAGGGLVSHPTLFKFAGGTGLMGEAGPEAIMPLRRDSSGRLGVAVSGSAGGVYAPQFNITVNNEGSGNMSDEQAQAMGRNLRDAIDTRVAENLSVYKRMGYFNNSFA